MGAPVRFQKAVPRTKEKRRGEAPIGAPARVMGRPFPSAEGTGFAVRRATGCGVPHQRLSALCPLGWGAFPNGGRAPITPNDAARLRANSNQWEEHAMISGRHPAAINPSSRVLRINVRHGRA
jgi:hypothetical protein